MRFLCFARYFAVGAAFGSYISAHYLYHTISLLDAELENKLAAIAAFEDEQVTSLQGRIALLTQRLGSQQLLA